MIDRWREDKEGFLKSFGPDEPGGMRHLGQWLSHLYPVPGLHQPGSEKVQKIGGALLWHTVVFSGPKREGEAFLRSSAGSTDELAFVFLQFWQAILAEDGAGANGRPPWIKCAVCKTPYHVKKTGKVPETCNVKSCIDAYSKHPEKFVSKL